MDGRQDNSLLKLFFGKQAVFACLPESSFFMKMIPLTRKYGIGKFAIIDDEDYDRLVAMGKWQARSHRGKIYAGHA